MEAVDVVTHLHIGPREACVKATKHKTSAPPPFCGVPSAVGGRRGGPRHGPLRRCEPCPWNWLGGRLLLHTQGDHQDDEHARSKHCSKPDSTAAAAIRAGGTLKCRETLEAGAAGMARAHLAVMLARPLLEGAALYPAAMARLHVATKARPPRAGLPEQALPIARGRPWLEADSGSRRPWGHVWLKLVWTGGATGATRGKPTGGHN